MNQELVKKYRPYPPVDLPDRTWPGKIITSSPTWCSVDLRDGNQALIQPMSHEKKLEMFSLLLKIGFKEIEVGFPSASEVEYAFIRTLIEDNLIPDDVVIQVLTPARESLIKKTFESVRGAKQAVIHLYNSTSTLQRRVR
jgi:2-isopropylmalate synthase